MLKISLALLSCVGLTGCVVAAKAPAHLTRERFSFVQWTNSQYRTERGLIRHHYPDWISNIGLLTGTQIYRVEGEFAGPSRLVRYECRSRAGEVPSVAARVPNAAYACFTDPHAPDFVLAFDARCETGVFESQGVRLRIVPWRHDRYGYQEGYFVIEPTTGLIRAALSWSHGPAEYDGVYVDPTLGDQQRDHLAIARGALLAMRQVEDTGPICALGSYWDRM